MEKVKLISERTEYYTANLDESTFSQVEIGVYATKWKNGIIGNNSKSIKPPSPKKSQLSTVRKFFLFMSAIFLQFTSVGFLYGLGVIYTDLIETLDASRTEASLVQSFTRGVSVGGGVVSGVLIRRYGNFPCVTVSTLMSSLGLLISAFSQNIYVIIVFTGIIAAFGYSSMILIGFTLVPFIFPRKEGIGFALVGVGTGTATLVFPLVFELLIQNFNWDGSFIIFSGILLNNLACGIVIRFSRIDDKHHDLKISSTEISYKYILGNIKYTVVLITNLFIGLTAWAEFSFSVDDMVLKGFDRETGASFQTIMGIACLVGRLLEGGAFTYFRGTKAIHHVTASLLILACSHVMFAVFTDYGALLMSSIVYGLSFSVYTALLSTCVHDIVGSDDFAIGYGMMNSANGIGNIIGGVVGDSCHDVIDSRQGIFTHYAILAARGSIASMVFYMTSQEAIPWYLSLRLYLNFSRLFHSFSFLVNGSITTEKRR